VDKRNPKRMNLYLEKKLKRLKRTKPIDAHTWKTPKRWRGQTHVDIHT